MKSRPTRPASVRALALLAALILLIAANSSSAAANTVYPNSIASTGDSITRAFQTGQYPLTDAPSNSWSTGTNSTVQSLYLRLLARNPGISGNNYNFAWSGAKMDDLQDQVSAAAFTQPQLLTILMGANDVCASSEASMTPVTTYRAQFEEAMQTLTTYSPNTRIYVLSIPNIYNLWAVLKGNYAARFVWDNADICQSMLANPGSTSTTDMQRRERVRQRNIDFNTQLAQVCAQYPQCRFDNNAVFNTTFTSSDVSNRDFFHPSIAGQAKLANVAWQASGFAP